MNNYYHYRILFNARSITEWALFFLYPSPIKIHRFVHYCSLFICIFTSLAQTKLYSFLLQLNDSTTLSTPVWLTNNTIQIPAYSNSTPIISDIIAKKDSIYFKVSIYENTCLLKKINDDLYAGKWIKYASFNKTYTIPCQLRPFVRPAHINIELMQSFPPHWKWIIQSSTNNYLALGTFQFFKNDILPHLSGSIATQYGDWGHLNGFIQQDTLYLSVFNGAFATQIIGKVFYSSPSQIDSIKGSIYYGNWNIEKFTAIPDNNFSIQHQIALKDIFNDTLFQLHHQWKDIDNNEITLQKNKPIILIIMGSWCPNCYDENQLFSQWYPQIAQQVQIIALSVERNNHPSQAIAILKKYRDKLKIPYPIVLLSTNSHLPFSLFPELKKIPAYPTTIYFNKNHSPVLATMGFNGPATHQLFLQTQKEIQINIQKILQ